MRASLLAGGPSFSAVSGWMDAPLTSIASVLRASSFMKWLRNQPRFVPASSLALPTYQLLTSRGHSPLRTIPSFRDVTALRDGHVRQGHELLNACARQEGSGCADRLRPCVNNRSKPQMYADFHI